MNELVGPVLNLIAAGVGAWVGIKAHLHYIRRDLDRVELKIENHETRIRAIEIGD